MPGEIRNAVILSWFAVLYLQWLRLNTSVSHAVQKHTHVLLSADILLNVRSVLTIRQSISAKHSTASRRSWPDWRTRSISWSQISFSRSIISQWQSCIVWGRFIGSKACQHACASITRTQITRPRLLPPTSYVHVAILYNLPQICAQSINHKSNCTG